MPNNLPEVSMKPIRLFSSKANIRLNKNFFKLKKYKKLHSNPNVRYQENNEMIESKIIDHLLTSIHRHPQNTLGSLNSANFLYQIFEKGKHIIENTNKKSQELIIKNSLKNKGSFKERCNTDCNIPTYSITENFTPTHVRKNYNRLKTLTSTFELNSMKNFESSKNKTKLKKYISLVEKNDSSKKYNNRYENYGNHFKISGKTKKSIENNGIEHLALIPIKNYIECQSNCISSTRKIPFKKKLNFVNKNYKRVGTFDKKNLKLFSEKYQKEKKDFNNILFDECINPRKKKIPLENFIKQFSDVHFIEKLYLSQDVH